MTCTDGRHPSGRSKTSPIRGSTAPSLARSASSCSMKTIISMPFVIRSMTGLAADFLRLEDRGYLREGMLADVAVFTSEADIQRPERPTRTHISTQRARSTSSSTERLPCAIGEHTGALAGQHDPHAPSEFLRQRLRMRRGERSLEPNLQLLGSGLARTT